MRAFFSAWGRAGNRQELFCLGLRPLRRPYVPCPIDDVVTLITRFRRPMGISEIKSLESGAA